MDASLCLLGLCGKLSLISFAKMSTSVNASIVYLDVVGYEGNFGCGLSDQLTEFHVRCTAQGSFFLTPVMP